MIQDITNTAIRVLGPEHLEMQCIPVETDKGWIEKAARSFAEAHNADYLSHTFDETTGVIDIKAKKRHVPEITETPEKNIWQEFADEVNQYFENEQKSAGDMVNHPSHYTQHKFECIDVIEEVTKKLTGIEAHCIGNIFKYLWRFNGKEDCEKAAWYLAKLISKLEENETTK